MPTIVSSSRLVSLLSPALAPDADPSAPDFALRLAQWLGAFDAVGLSAAHQRLQAAATTRPGTPPPERGASATDRASDAPPDGAGVQGTAAPRSTASVADPMRPLRQALEQAQRALSDSIAAGIPGLPPMDQAPLPTDVATGFAPYRRRHQELQGRMQARIERLRRSVRATLAERAPRLQQLAVLDAALEQAFGARTQQVLAALPGLVERRYAQWLAQAQQAATTDGTPTATASGTTGTTGTIVPARWPDGFGDSFQALLMAELEVRLQPVVGMIEAFSQERAPSP